MPTKLAQIVQTYFNDTEYQDERASVAQSRNSSIATLKRTTENFINRTTDLTTFRSQLNSALPSKDTWGARGPEFLMELNKLVKNHAAFAQGYRIENKLREILTGLQAQTLGNRIEQMYVFLQEERIRFRQEGRPNGTNVSPGNSAMIVSLFSHWLDWTGDQVIYYLSLRQGLKKLLDYNLLPPVEGLHIANERIILQTDVDHQAAMRVIHNLQQVAPRLKTETGIYWTEHFLYWLVNHPEVLTEESNTGDTPSIHTITHKPLRAISEQQLQERIAQLQKRLLVDEKVVRRIYHALLAGHVILTGPPGTGKTELARAIPELLWQEDEESAGKEPGAYTSMLVTATDEWSVRTLIGGLAPRSINGQVVYTIQYGHLTEAIRSNWNTDADDARTWGEERTSVYADSYLEANKRQEFRGQWLIIDEFNRAPIDLALGDAMTALSNGNGGKLRVPTDDGYAMLPLPQDFRIIGTLNSFDRNYLNQISEALKRRFSFIEVLPPTRAQSQAEARLALYKALESVRHISDEVDLSEDGMLSWRDIINVGKKEVTSIEPLHRPLTQAWYIFEVIRIYRQLGTAQAVAFFRHMFIAIITQELTEEQQWRDAVDAAFCDTIADQLQILLPEELDVLYSYMKQTDDDAFFQYYQALLGKLAPRRKQAQLEALSMIVREDGTAILSEEEVERLGQVAEPKIDKDLFDKIFRLDLIGTRFVLPQFARRLRTFKAERSI